MDLEVISSTIAPTSCVIIVIKLVILEESARMRKLDGFSDCRRCWMLGHVSKVITIFIVLQNAIAHTAHNKHKNAIAHTAHNKHKHTRYTWSKHLVGKDKCLKIVLHSSIAAFNSMVPLQDCPQLWRQFHLTVSNISKYV